MRLIIPCFRNRRTKNGTVRALQSGFIVAIGPHGAVGWSSCNSEHDEFDYNLGLDLALGRAVRAAGGERARCGPPPDYIRAAYRQLGLKEKIGKFFYEAPGEAELVEPAQTFDMPFAGKPTLADVPAPDQVPDQVPDQNSRKMGAGGHRPRADVAARLALAKGYAKAQTKA